MPSSYILPESSDNTLCVRIEGVAREEDSGLFYKAFRERVEKNGYCNVCVIYDEGFQGWTEEAADNSLKNVIAIAPYVRKVALVNPPDSRRLMVTLLKPMGAAEVRYYDLGEEQQAFTWIKTD